MSEYTKSILKNIPVADLEEEIQSRKNFPKTVAQGVLKECLVVLSEENILRLEFSDWLITFTELQQKIEQIDKYIDVLPKGTPFLKIQFREDEEAQWFDNIDFGIECMDDKWAQKHLEEIQVFSQLPLG